METVLQLSDTITPSTLTEVVEALQKESLKARLESKTWGDWIYIEDYQTVISIDSSRGFTSSATIEHGEDEEHGEPVKSICRAFGKIGWNGINADGPFSL